jgi:N-acetylmuramoyl-L-alanine amidase
MFKHRIILILFIQIIITAGLFGQQESRVTLSINNVTRQLLTFERHGAVYVSASHIAEAFSIKSLINLQSEKVELQFPSYTFKITAKNPYLVITSRTYNESKVFQLPISSVIMNNEIYFPIEYSYHLLALASQKKIAFDKNRRLLTIESRQDSPSEDVFIEHPLTETAEPVKPLLSFHVNALNISERANGTLVRVRSSEKITDFRHSMKGNSFIVQIRNTTVNVDELKKLAGKGVIKGINATNTPNYGEIEFIVTEDFSSGEVMKDVSPNDLLITLHSKRFARTEPVSRKEKWNLDVIVIDAGHGGKDAGAIAVNGAKEKDINLAIALKLGKLLEQNLPEVKVVYTRKTDIFVELYKRGKIANENNGKLFISIHCNSTANKKSTASGFEVYLLRPGRTDDAIAIAEIENSVIKYEENPDRYQQLTDENFILVSMAHASYMQYSETFADLMIKHFSKGLNLPSRGVKQAGFYVLVGASMPSILIETGFLSNKKDADYLVSAAGQNKIAASIYDAIKQYKLYYDQIMEMEL